jgi:ribosomal protein L35AE/L33A
MCITEGNSPKTWYIGIEEATKYINADVSYRSRKVGRHVVGIFVEMHPCYLLQNALNWS